MQTNPSSEKSIRLFKNPILERMTHVHPIMPLVIWVPIISYLLWNSYSVIGIPLWGILTVGLFGLLTWTLVEYVLHRFVFHYAARGPVTERLVYLFHGIHHDDPQDATRLVMPPVPAIALGGLFYGIFYLCFGPNWVGTFFSFFILGYLAYDYTHYAVHHFTPHTRWGRYLKQNHMNHHYASPETRWGVSSPLWDMVFGTMNPREELSRHAK